ncbi:unnamed protein product [Caenorhabditis angaria]|uniref:CC domain-containing protein n=1 Tax=Caenorhabditis angaria TaxID=860376 RepID=A0A9P1IT05_9PELO|nr:unnamed protein product [Caenorhabditis angaria]
MSFSIFFLLILTISLISAQNCPPGVYCPYGTPCSSNQDCPANEFCYDGICEDLPTIVCTLDNASVECQPNQYCYVKPGHTFGQCRDR